MQRSPTQRCKSLACSRVMRNNRPRTGEGWVRAMSQSDAGFDFDRYRRLLAEADDEAKRLAFINLLVDEKAKDKLAGQSLRGRLAALGLKADKQAGRSCNRPCPRSRFTLGCGRILGANDATSGIGAAMGGTYVRADDRRYRHVPDRLFH